MRYKFVTGVIHPKPFPDSYTGTYLRDKEVTPTSRALLGLPVFVEHRTNGSKPIGTVWEVKEGHDRKIFVKLRIDCLVPGALEAVRDVQNQKLQGLSWGSNSQFSFGLAKYKDIEFTEVSLCRQGDINGTHIVAVVSDTGWVFNDWSLSHMTKGIVDPPEAHTLQYRKVKMDDTNILELKKQNEAMSAQLAEALAGLKGQKEEMEAFKARNYLASKDLEEIAAELATYKDAEFNEVYAPVSDFIASDITDETQQALFKENVPKFYAAGPFGKGFVTIFGKASKDLTQTRGELETQKRRYSELEAEHQKALANLAVKPDPEASAQEESRIKYNSLEERQYKKPNFAENFAQRAAEIDKKKAAEREQFNAMLKAAATTTAATTTTTAPAAPETPFVPPTSNSFAAVAGTASKQAAPPATPNLMTGIKIDVSASKSRAMNAKMEQFL